MDDSKKVQLNLCIPEHYRDQLRKMAARKILENPGKVITAASLGMEIICGHLDSLNDNHAKKEDLYNE
jgi:hypothetical protein